jgi:GTP-binding protein EngB required for normal cell division
MERSLEVNRRGLQTESNLGSLKHYSRLKLELASTIRSIMQLARRRNDDAHGVECQKLLARLAEDRFNLAVVGQFNRGKTSLMNALLGLDRLPTGVLPLTSVVTTVCYGDRERALIRLKDSSLSQEIPLEDLPRFVTEKDNPGNAKQVALAEVHLPADLLRFGFFFTDTPGVGSLITANTTTTRQFLPEVDAAIFVTSFESPFTEGELDFFEEVRGHVQTVFVVINKADLVAADQRDEIVAFIREKLGQKLGEVDLPVFAVSAREGLDAKLARGGKLARSGLLELERALVHFLRTQKARVLLTRVTDRVEGLLKAQQAELDVAESATADPQKATLAEQHFRANVDRLRCEQDRILEPLCARISSELISRFDGEFTAWSQEIRTELMDRAQTFLKSADWFTLLARAPELTAQVCGACQERVRMWFAEHERDFQRVIHEIAADYTKSLDRSADEALKIDVALLTGDSSIESERSIDIIDRLSLLYPQPPPLHWSFRTRWWIHALPFRFAKDIVLRQCSENLEESLSAYYMDEIRSSLRFIASEWVNGLRLKLAESLSAAITRAEKILHAKPEPEERTAINVVLVKLEELRNVIADLQDETDIGVEPADGDAIPDHRAEGAPRSNVLANCVICFRIEDELFQFMSNRQYELSTSESERLGHVECGGFCALHTWVYEAMASPQGICIAYPAVLISFSRQLHSLAQGAASSSAVADGVMQLLPQPPTCRACQLISSIEQDAAKEIVASLTGRS